MSIFIKGVDMPINGKEIHLRIDSHGEVYVYNTYPTMIGDAVEVPTPHGRLIDADALDDVVFNLIESGCYITRNDYKQLSSMIFEWPTVIEAEE